MLTRISSTVGFAVGCVGWHSSTHTVTALLLLIWALAPAKLFEERVTCSLPACRQSLPTEVFQRQYSNVTEGIGGWDLYPPDYNCPLLKERVGQLTPSLLPASL